ncbi:hypothetical protein ACHAPA_004558 [Fusarium lateritium]
MADNLARIVNYRWRALFLALNKNPLESFPASSDSVEDDDIVPVEHRYPDGYRGWTAAIRYNPDQQWYYLSGTKLLK